MLSADEQRIANALTANWAWVPNWIDFSSPNTAGRIVKFTRQFNLSSNPAQALLYFSADTRYKLYVNGQRVAVGPARSSTVAWYYDSLDVGPFLHQGENEIKFVVIRYFAASRAAMPFARTQYPGLTVFGSVEAGSEIVDVSTSTGWLGQVNENISFPTGLIDDVFLHINERIHTGTTNTPISLQEYNIKTLNGELSPWRLKPRPIPMPESSPVIFTRIRVRDSEVSENLWLDFFTGRKSLILAADSSHIIDVQADVHSTAFLKWSFKAANESRVKLKMLFSEGYELKPRNYPFFRSKADRLDASNGFLIGPFDEAVFDLPVSQTIAYEPFWFRTFRILRIEIAIGSAPVELVSFEATQVNYPLTVKGSWKEPGDLDSGKIWDVSLRTMRNCMFDGYSDCPFYEQLQYAGDTRTVGLFHYLTCGDDRLMRQAISSFALSITPDGLTHSRFPSHVPQVIAGFALYWILMVSDHHLFFGDKAFTRSFLPRIDGVLEFFETHVDHLGLVSGLPEEVWQFVDWVTTWGATDEHPDKGVPTSGRRSNRHTYFSMLYALTLKQAASLARQVGRPGHAEEYQSRAASLLQAIQQHCYDGNFFTDSTTDVADDSSYSQHCQVFAVLCGAAEPTDRARLLQESFTNPRFSKCSYMMRFYAFRAFALAGDEVYESFWPHAWDPWRQMLRNNLTTWEEDDVRQRSDCHAWGSVPLYEYCTELAGIQPVAAGCVKILFKPRLRLTESLEAKVALGSDNVAAVSWEKQETGETLVELRLEKAVEVVSRLPGQEEQEHGVVDKLVLTYSP